MDLSIVITTFNYEQYLESCLASCIDQIGHGIEYEIILIDDGSTDGTGAILDKSFPEKVRIFRRKNVGIERASNFGFANAEGEYLMRVDADDMLLPSYLATMEKYLSDDFGFYYPDYQVIDGSGRVIKNMKLPPFDPAEILQRGDFLATGTLFNKNLMKEYGAYRTAVKNNGLENYEFILDLIQMEVLGFHVSEKLFLYRRHGSNISDVKKNKIIRNGKNLFKRNHLGVFTTNEYHPYELKIE